MTLQPVSRIRAFRVALALVLALLSVVLLGVFIDQARAAPLVEAPHLPALLSDNLQSPWGITETFCIPVAQGVPGAGGPPDWWSSPGAPRDDPRWRGAVQRTFSAGTSRKAAWRALYYDDSGTRYLYYSFDVRFDPSLDPNEDILVFGIASTTTQHLFIVRPIPDQNAHTADSLTSTPEYYTRSIPGTAWIPQSAPPTWLSGTTAQTRFWVVKPGPGVNEWTVQVRIPASSLITGGAFGFYTNLLVKMGIGGLTQYHWPRATADISEVFGAPDLPDGVPPLDQWGEGRIGGGLECKQGIDLSSWAQIGSIDNRTGIPASSNLIFTDTTNTLFAWPSYSSTTALAAGQLTATFRLANWGASAQWIDIRGGSSIASNRIITAAEVGPGVPITNAPITFTWTLNSAEIAFYNAHPHQCMLVELISSGNVDFASASVVRNMDFAKASTVEDEAELNVTGLGDPPPGLAGHRLWIYLETRNMPEPTLGSQLSGAVEYLVDWFGQLIGGLGRRGDEVGIARQRRVVGWSPDWPLRGVDPDTLSTAENWPIYRVNVFYETGEFITVDKEKLPVLAELGSYGYFMRHEGLLTGWQSELAGLEQRGPNVYTVVLPKDGVAKVTDKIVAAEPSPILAFGLLILVLLLLLLILRALVRQLRRRSPTTGLSNKEK